MAFDRTYLGNVGPTGSNAPTVHSFLDAASTKAQIAAADYFLGAYDALKVYDRIICTGSDGTIILVVTASSSTTVTTELLETTTV